MSYKEDLHRVWRLYEQEHGVPATTREAIEWGIARNLIPVPDVDPLAKLSEDMAMALREEYATGPQGRRYRVNHAVQVTRGGVQYTFWAIMKDAPRAHMQKAFIQRREQIVDDCVQLATDVEAFNAMNSEQPSIPILFDFRNDVEERRFWDIRESGLGFLVARSSGNASDLGSLLRGERSGPSWPSLLASSPRPLLGLSLIWLFDLPGCDVTDQLPELDRIARVRETLGCHVLYMARSPASANPPSRPARL